MKVSKQTRTSIKSHSFYNTISLKKPQSFYKPQIAQHCKYIYSRNTTKILTHSINFPANMFPVGVRKNSCTTPFLNTHELYSQGTWKENVCIFLYISVRKESFCFKDIWSFRIKSIKTLKTFMQFGLKNFS